MLSCEFCSIFKNTFFIEHFWWLLLQILNFLVWKLLQIRKKNWNNSTHLKAKPLEYSRVSNRRGRRKKQGSWQISAKTIDGEGAINVGGSKNLQVVYLHKESFPNLSVYILINTMLIKNTTCTSNSFVALPRLHANSVDCAHELINGESCIRHWYWYSYWYSY